MLGDSNRGRRPSLLLRQGRRDHRHQSRPRLREVASNRFWSAADFAQRDAAKEKAAAILPKPPEGKGPGCGPPLPKEELEATRYSAVGDVVYGVAVVDGTFFVRTGTELICVRALISEN